MLGVVQHPDSAPPDSAHLRTLVSPSAPPPREGAGLSPDPTHPLHWSPGLESPLKLN